MSEEKDVSKSLSRFCSCCDGVEVGWDAYFLRQSQPGDAYEVDGYKKRV